MSDYAKQLLEQDNITFEEFQKFAISTRQYDDKFHGLAVCFMKLPGELNEFLKERDIDKKRLEAGDVLWKIANICDYIEISKKEINICPRFDKIDIYEYLENSGKMIRDKNLKHNTRKNAVIKYMEHCLIQVTNSFINMTAIYRANIIKLTERKEKGTILNR